MFTKTSFYFEAGYNDISDYRSLNFATKEKAEKECASLLKFAKRKSKMYDYVNVCREKRIPIINYVWEDVQVWHWENPENKKNLYFKSAKVRNQKTTSQLRF